MVCLVAVQVPGPPLQRALQQGCPEEALHEQDQQASHLHFSPGQSCQPHTPHDEKTKSEMLNSFKFLYCNEFKRRKKKAYWSFAENKEKFLHAKKVAIWRSEFQNCQMKLKAKFDKAQPPQMWHLRSWNTCESTSGSTTALGADPNLGGDEGQFFFKDNSGIW